MSKKEDRYHLIFTKKVSNNCCIQIIKPVTIKLKHVLNLSFDWNFVKFATLNKKK